MSELVLHDPRMVTPFGSTVHVDVPGGQPIATEDLINWGNASNMDLGPIPEPKPEDKPTTFISIDLETTGLEMDKHGIIQIGAWATGEDEDHFKDYFLMDVNPHIISPDCRQSVQVSEEALKVNGFTPARIEDGLPIWTAMRDFNRWLRKWDADTTTICIGQNVAFDIAWLKRDFYRQGLDTGIFRRNVDCYTLSFLAFGMPLGLGKLAAKLGIKYPAHDALSDSYTASKCFHRLRKRFTYVDPTAPKLTSGFQQVYNRGAESTCVR